MPKVLIVEDNELNLKLFSDLLAHKKYQVILSRDGVNIPAIAINDKPDVILMDIQLKGKSGLEIINSLKLNPETSHIPIISITAFAMQSDQKRILDAGSDAYLSKPVSLDLFYKTLEKFINHKHTKVES